MARKIIPMKVIKRRRGLAPLEFVLVLPLMMFIMALMINFGAIASWKVRGLSVARNAAWANRAPRTDAYFWRPESWPASADYGAAETPAAVPLGSPWIDEYDPRNIFIGAAEAPMFFQGRAHLARRHPMRPPGLSGRYDLTARTELLDDNWDFQRMGLRWNEDLRIPLTLPASGQGDWSKAYNQALIAAYDRACWDVIRTIFPNLDAATPGPLWPLGWPPGDDEFSYYYSLGLGPGILEFHPALRFGCGGAAEARMAVDDLIRRLRDTDISDNPAHRMTDEFIRLYQEVLNNYQRITGEDLPPQLRQRLQQNIDTLTQFRATL